MNEHGEQAGRDQTRHRLILHDAPALTGESAEVVMQWLCWLMDALGSEYAAEIEAHRRRQQRRRFEQRDPAAPWRTCPSQTQLSLDLDDDYPF